MTESEKDLWFQEAFFLDEMFHEIADVYCMVGRIPFRKLDAALWHEIDQRVSKVNGWIAERGLSSRFVLTPLEETPKPILAQGKVEIFLSPPLRAEP